MAFYEWRDEKNWIAKLLAFYVEGDCAIDALDIDVRDVLGLEVLRMQKHIFVYGNFGESSLESDIMCAPPQIVTARF